MLTPSTASLLRHPLVPLIGMLLIVVLLISAMAFGEPLLLASPFLAIALLIGAYVVFRALRGDPLGVYALTFIIIFLANAVFRVRDFDDKSLDLQTMIKALSWVIALLFTLIYAGRTFYTLFVADRILWTFLFIWMFFSATYAPNPTYAFVCLFSLFTMYLFFQNVFARYDAHALIMAIILACGLFALLSLIAYVFIPTFGRVSLYHDGQLARGWRMSGIGGSPNNVAAVMSLGLILSVFYWRELIRPYRVTFVTCVVLCTTALMLTNTRMSIGLVIVIAGLYLFGNIRRMPFLLLGFTLIVMLVCLAIPFSDEILALLSRSGDTTEIMTGNNRAIIWYTVIHIADQSPWVGWGYAATVFILPQYSEQLMHMVVSAHNVMLQMWFTTGYIGLALFLGALTISFLRALSTNNRRSFLLLFFVFLNGISEAGPFSNTLNFGSIALFLALSIPLERKVSHTASKARPF